MNNNKNLPNFDVIKQELLEILNQKEVLLKLDNVLRKYGLLENKDITIEFNFIDKIPQVQTNNSSRENAVSATTAKNVQQLSFGFCPSCPPPPGRII